MGKNIQKILRLSCLALILLVGVLVYADKVQAQGQWCARCSNIKPCTYVTWYDRDGGCDDDWFNQRTENQMILVICVHQANFAVKDNV